jgi:hypothetical protein
MSEPVSFSEQLRAWQQRKEARVAVRPAAATASSSDNLLPFRRRFDAGLEDEPKGAVPWLDRLRAEPWVATVED